MNNVEKPLSYYYKSRQKLNKTHLGIYKQTNRDTLYSFITMSKKKSILCNVYIMKMGQYFYHLDYESKYWKDTLC